MKYFTLNLLGLTRSLPIVDLPVGIRVAGFNPLGDTQLITRVCADLNVKIAEKQIPFDLIVTTECKGIPFAHELAKSAEVDYVVFRKEPKVYLGENLSFEGASITSGNSKFYLSQQDQHKIRGKKILFIDDVFSSGSTYNGVVYFLSTLNAQVTGIAVALTEGVHAQEYKGVPILSSGFVPIFTDR